MIEEQIAMDLDELKEKWIDYDRKLDESLRLNRQLLKTMKMSRVRSALHRMAVLSALESVLWFAAIVALGSFIYRHITLMRFALPAAILDLYVIANFAVLIAQIASALQIDYDRPISIIQKQIEALHVLCTRYIQLSVLGGFIVWMPLVIVLFKGFFGVDIYRLFNTTWIVANVLFGLAPIAFAIWLSKKLSKKASRHPRLQKFMRDLAGYNINAARDFIATLSEFDEKEQKSSPSPAKD
jgi:hypothetical protein